MAKKRTKRLLGGPQEGTQKLKTGGKKNQNLYRGKTGKYMVRGGKKKTIADRRTFVVSCWKGEGPVWGEKKAEREYPRGQRGGEGSIKGEK